MQSACSDRESDQRPKSCCAVSLPAKNIPPIPLERPERAREKESEQERKSRKQIDRPSMSRKSLLADDDYDGNAKTSNAGMKAKLGGSGSFCCKSSQAYETSAGSSDCNNGLEDVKQSYYNDSKSEAGKGSCYLTSNNSSSSNNNNNNKLASYSKILRQYLPDSLNLNALNYVSNINNNITASKRRNYNYKDRKPQPQVDSNSIGQPQEQPLLLEAVGVEQRRADTKGRQVKRQSDSVGGCGWKVGQYDSNSDYNDQDDDATVLGSVNPIAVDTLNIINSKSSPSGKTNQVARVGPIGSNARSSGSKSGDHDQLVPSHSVKSESSKQNESSDWWKRRIGFLYLKDSRRESSNNLITQSQPTKSERFVKNRRQNKISKKTFDLNNNFSQLVKCNRTSGLNLGDDDRLISESEEADSEEKMRPNQAASMEANQTKDINNNNIHKGNQSHKSKLNPMKATYYGLAISLALIGLLASTGRLVIGQQIPAQPPPGFRSHPQPQSLQQSPPAPSNGLLSGTNSATTRPSPQPAAGSLVANINCNKIRGHVTFTPSTQNQVGATVSTQINEGPPGEVYQWSIHQFPVKPGAAMCTCSPLILGSKLVDLSEMHGNLPSNQEFSVQTSLPLFGSDSPVGHSLMLRGLKTGVVACATFLPTSRKANYRAKFHQPLSGSVTVFQTAFGSSFLSHLMYSNGTRRHSMHRFDIVKSDDDVINRSLLAGTQASSLVQPSNGNQLIEQREHDNELTQCRRFASGEALFRNMTYQLSVSTENFGMRSRTALVLPQIPFETFSSVYVIIYSEYNPNEPIACAPLKFVKPKTVAAKFQTVSVQGNVVFSQESPYDPTIARVNLQLPNSDGHSYGIDELPMIIRRKSDTRVCPNIREIIYNPHHIEPSTVPGEGEATSDQYAVGDLSGKYGSLAGKSNEKIQVNDYNLPLFGPNSIIGRAMTIYSADGVAIACSNVELTTPMTTAFATFDFGIQGQFIFRQPQNDCNGDTYVYIEVSKPMGSQPSSSSTANQQQLEQQARTLDHNWHIHVNPIDSGLDHLSTTECTAAGPHFNPYNTSTASIYSRDCTPFNVLRCELGDLSSKMFTLEIPPYRVKGGQEPDIGKFFGTDIDLPLCGPVSIVNRSVVVHTQDFGMQRMACSTVIEFKPRN